ncbi:MAG: 6-carboxytetrahydropterin synthase QueD [Planctomycetes bacterium]|nr:6-carboxytetrahydropterin synthase QueD [Planctomycetota bacterium]
MYELTIETDFAAAHRLNGYDGPCENLHGHNWKVLVAVRSQVVNNLQMVMDFKDLKALVNPILDGFDHKYLNEIPPFDTENPTTERISRHLAELLAGKLPEGIKVARIQVWESDRASAAYLPDES